MELQEINNEWEIGLFQKRNWFVIPRKVILWVQLTHDPCHPMDFKTVQ
jgi:hypothetical protein